MYQELVCVAGALLTQPGFAVYAGSVVGLRSAEPLGEITRELLIRGRGVARELLDIVGRKVTVARTVGLRVLVERISQPFWNASAEHGLLGRFQRDVDIADFLAQYLT